MPPSRAPLRGQAGARPVVVVGAGPVGLITAIGLAHHGIPVVVYEDDDRLSLDTKAGTILSRTLEILRRFSAADAVLAKALRIDEIGEIDRRTQVSRFPVKLHELADETRYPFVINLPQHDLEPVLAAELERLAPGALRLRHRFVRFETGTDSVTVHLEGPDGPVATDAAYLLACDGGRSAVRAQLGLGVQGHSLPEKYALIDLKVDLDVENPRDYPYLSYFPDPEQWMILVRHPHCWRFLFPLVPGQDEPDMGTLQAQALAFIGEVRNVEPLNRVVYSVHHRVAERWREGRVFLMGDAAHLITPMWGLGITTGALDASNLPWRLAWVMRGWADDALLDGYEREQRPVAQFGSGEMAEAARLYMHQRRTDAEAMTQNNWSNAYTRGLLGVRLDVAGSGDWSMVKRETRPPVRIGDRVPDMLVHTPAGTQRRLHELIDDRFLALYFVDARRRPAIPPNFSPALAHYVVSRWDAPHDSGLRERALLDPGDALRRRLGIEEDSVVLVRPDEHIAAIAAYGSLDGVELYRRAVGAAPPEAAGGVSA